MFRPTPRSGRVNPLSAAAVLLIVVGVVGLLRGRGGPDEACDGLSDTVCTDAADPDASASEVGHQSPVLTAAEGCRDVGYLCAALSDSDRIVVRRWRALEGPLVVSVPLPPLPDPGAARALQRAAAAGIRLWNGQPFPILLDERGTRQADVVVQWGLAPGGSQLGLTHTEWSEGGGLRVRGLALAVEDPRSGRDLDPAQVRLTAAHEMGHALGLPHSDQPSDVMFPTNTATTLSARDYRTLEALYALADGTEIVR
jgi:hypothetical protein